MSSLSSSISSFLIKHFWCLWKKIPSGANTFKFVTKRWFIDNGLECTALISIHRHIKKSLTGRELNQVKQAQTNFPGFTLARCERSCMFLYVLHCSLTYLVRQSKITIISINQFREYPFSRALIGYSVSGYPLVCKTQVEFWPDKKCFFLAGYSLVWYMEDWGMGRGAWGMANVDGIMQV